MSGSLEGMVLVVLVVLAAGLGFAYVRLLGERSRDADRFRAESDELKNQKAAIEAEKRVLEGQVPLLREQLTEANRKTETLENRIETLKQGTEAETVKSAGLARDLEHATRRKGEAERELEVLRAERTRLSEELVALKEQEPIRINEHDQRIIRLNESIANVEK
ncbi:MAG: hypothetical protein EBX52_14320, partial [Proteobacteria bacterium]|nr:hypothetical protein [Pseudomonadota bacterium]